MIDGPALRDARNRAEMTQQQLATLLGVTLRTVGNWERGETVPRAKEPQIRSLLGEFLGLDDETPTLRQATDAELLGEVARRLGQRERAESPTPIGSTEARRRRLRDAAQPVEQAAGRSEPRVPTPEPESQDPGDMEPR